MTYGGFYKRQPGPQGFGVLRLGFESRRALLWGTKDGMDLLGFSKEEISNRCYNISSSSHSVMSIF